MILSSYVLPNGRLTSTQKQSNSALQANLKDLFQGHSYFDLLVSFGKQLGDTWLIAMAIVKVIVPE